MVFLLWAHSGNGNRLESTYYHRGAAFLWVAVWWGSRRKVGETVNMYTEKGKMWKKPPSKFIFIPAATFLFNSKLRNHLWLTIMEGARLRCKQVPIWTEKIRSHCGGAGMISISPIKPKPPLVTYNSVTLRLQVRGRINWPYLRRWWTKILLPCRWSEKCLMTLSWFRSWNSHPRLFHRCCC